METTLDQVVAALNSMTIPEIVSLTKKLEADWGVSATPQALPNTQFLSKTDAVVEQKTEFDVKLVSYPADKKMALVKLVREVCGLGLLESKNLVESAPKPLKEGVSKDEASAIQAKVQDAGGVCEVS